MNAENIILFNQVTKQFGKKSILEPFDLVVKKPDIIALLGVNGAGKTTMIKLLLGLLKPTAGTVRVFGQDPVLPFARKRVGTTPQNIDFPEGLKVKEVIEFAACHYSTPLSLHSIADMFEITELLDSKAVKLSGGQKRRVALALAFVGNPDLVFLDEPTTGLDVGARKNLLDKIYSEHKKGKTIFLTTHYLGEIESIATRVLFLHKGRISFDGTVEELKKTASSSLKKVIFYSAEKVSFESFSSVEKYSEQDNFYTVETYNSDTCLRELVNNKIPFQDLIVKSDTLEDAFMSYTETQETDHRKEENL